MLQQFLARVFPGIFLCVTCLAASMHAPASDIKLGRPSLANDLGEVVRTIRVSPDGRYMLAGAQDVQFYSAATLKPIGDKIPGRIDVNDAAFSSDGKQVAIARNGVPVSVYRLGLATPVSRSSVSASFWEVEFLGQTNQFIACGGQGTIYRFDAADGSLLNKIETPYRFVSGLAALHGGRQIVTAGVDQQKRATVEIRDVETLTVVTTLQSGTTQVDRMVVSDSGNELYVCSKDGALSRFDLQSRKRTGQWKLDQTNVRDIRLIEGRQKLFVGGWYRRLSVLNLATDEVQQLDAPEGRGLTAINVLSSPDRVIVAPGSPKNYRFAAWPFTSPSAVRSTATKNQPPVRPPAQPIVSNQKAMPNGTALKATLPLPPPVANGSKVRVVLFCPKGVRPPANYQQGIDRLCDYADNFILKGIESWGGEPVTESLFYREDEGVKVHGIIGQQTADAYTDPSVHKEAITSAMKHYQLKPKDDLWWVLVYLGDPPARFAEFRGGRSPQFGGWSVANYDSRAPMLRPNTLIAGDLGDSMALKGMIHELGHAFGLPHIGPRPSMRKGNTLMGPTNANFRRVTGRKEPIGYLSEASAAMLSAHPVVRQRTLSSRRSHAVAVTKFAATTNRNSVTINGQIRSDNTQRFAILANDRNDLPGDYWPKHYVGSVSANGQFRFEVTDFDPTGGTLRLWFVFADGTLSGNGKDQGARSALKLNYTLNGNQVQFRKTIN